MRNAVIFCLLFAVFVFAQYRESVAVLPSVGELDPQRLELLTDKVREIASKTLPQKNFMLLKLDAIIKRIGEEELYRSCKEGVCIGELARKASSDYGARCDIFKVDNNPVLKFELYDVKEEAIVETFTDYDVKDFRGMLAALEARLPDAFKKMAGASKGRDMTVSIIPQPLPLPAPILPLPIVPAAEPQTTPVAKPAQDTVVSHVQETEAPEPKKGLWMAHGYGVAFKNNFGGEIDLKQTVIKGWVYNTGVPVDSNVVTCKKKPYNQVWGILMFYEIPYVGIFAEALWGNVKLAVEEKRQNASTNSTKNYELNNPIMSGELGVFGKYPIAVSEKMTWFPIAGIYYGFDEVDIAHSTGDSFIFSFEALSFKSGAGLNVALGETLFLRSEALYNIGIPIVGFFKTEMEKQDVEIKKMGLNHGITLRVSLGLNKKLW